MSFFAWWIEAFLEPFHFAVQLGMYVEKGKEHEAKAAQAPPPPPPKWRVSAHSDDPSVFVLYVLDFLTVASSRGGKSSDKTTPVKTTRPESGLQSKYAALPGLEQVASASPGSLAPSWSRPASGTKPGKVKTFVPDIAAARAAMVAEVPSPNNNTAKDGGELYFSYYCCVLTTLQEQ